MSAPSPRRTFTTAVDALTTQVRQDSSILAAILGGSLAHDTVWDKSDVDLVLITIDEAKVSAESISLYADGVNVHAILVQRAEFRRMVEVNLLGTFQVTQVFGSAMADAGRGSIVNIGSLYASVAPEPAFYDHIPGFLKPPAYGASKAGVVALTKYFARLWGPRGVRVNALSPGGVLGGQDEQFLGKFTARVPLRRMAEDEDLVGPLLFLASDASRYVTGQELRVDGGFTA